MFCYDCHEELLHNPVFLPEDLDRFATLVRTRGLAESKKMLSKRALAGRIQLLHEALALGLRALLKRESRAG